MQKRKNGYDGGLVLTDGKSAPMTEFVFPAPLQPTLPVEGGGLFPIRRVFCVGRNYADHAKEMGGDPTKEAPIFFTKPNDAVTTLAAIPFDDAAGRLDYEGEMVVALGKGGTNIDAAAALEHVFGYSVGCDLTRRALQAEFKKAGQPWDMAKGFDLSGPVANIQPSARIGHPTHAALTLSVNGVVKQQGDIDQMTWSVPDIIAFLSRLVALKPGDLIFTGTPAGVGPLSRGDAVEVKLEGVAQLNFRLV
jgi:fumarylpyruvate hydrolase